MRREIRKVLVIKLSALGDFVLALAAMKHIREAHPKAQITLLTTPPFEAWPGPAPTSTRWKPTASRRDPAPGWPYAPG